MIKKPKYEKMDKREKKLIKFFSTRTLVQLQRNSQIKWSCIRRVYMRHNYLNAEMFHHRCAFCHNSDFNFDKCQVNHKLCDQCYFPSEIEMQDKAKTLYQEIYIQYKNKEDILPLLNKMIKEIVKISISR